ncbi:GTPase-binding protein rid1 [Leucoagaricus sp. SymC.cos]|nr:GTPase-binding protein rid1 [Leucoagaricus sp. SymC.cos]
MFKSILPSRRPPSSDFTMVTSLQDVSNSKENYPSIGMGPQPTNRGAKNTLGTGKTGAHLTDKKKRTESRNMGQYLPSPIEQVEMDHAFDQLLDDLQIPSSLRPKLVGMDSTVKAAMLKSSTILAKQPREVPSVLPGTPKSGTLRRALSTESLGSPLQNLSVDQDTFDPPRPPFAGGQVSAHHSPYLSGSPSRKASGTHGRGLSFDAQRLFSRSQVNLAMESSVDLTPGFGAFNAKEKSAMKAKSISPTKFCSILTSTSSLQLELEDIKKLRLLLRNDWSQDFLKSGGYSALLTRLNELLEVEWREEQHDDQVLHELLRCFKALSTSSIGCFALRSSCPTPFVQLVSLLYSDKKPGDVATRQLIVDLLLLLFDLYPPSSLPSGSSRRQREAWESDTSLPSSNLIVLPVPHKNIFSLIRALLLTPAPPKSECPKTPISPHAFIENLHKPRIYKTYLQELSDVCRDYFWVFCHPNNSIWVLSETDETKVEKPRAPGGMTGGVEFEATGYLATHFKLINAIAQSVSSLGMPKESDLSAHRFHTDLFLSGLERIILISRKASTTYYPTLHLEISRYINYAIRAGYELPYTVSRLIGFPPAALCKNPQLVAAAAANVAQQIYGQSSGRCTPRQGVQSQPSTPTKCSAAPAIPSPKRVEPLHFD